VRQPSDRDSLDWDDQQLADQQRRLRLVSIDERLQEVIAWSAVLLADQLQRSSESARNVAPDPVGLGRRRS
jgi:hypothetical protein